MEEALSASNRRALELESQLEATRSAAEITKERLQVTRGYWKGEGEGRKEGRKKKGGMIRLDSDFPKIPSNRGID